MKQTAVKWLIEQLKENNMLTFDEWTELFNQAKQMEKEQIKNALQEFLDVTLPHEVFEKYYNETFKSE